MKIIGFTAGAFDLLHAGHYMMFKEASKKCDVLVVFLEEDPSLDRPEKNKPIESLEERKLKLESCKYIDEVIVYNGEKGLLAGIKQLQKEKIDKYQTIVNDKSLLRIIGEEYRDKNFTGKELDIPVYFNSRKHNHSSTNLRKRVYEAEKQKHE